MSEEVSFEAAMEKLEKIVENLESGELSLDKALKNYEEGVRLSRICQQRLTEAEKKVEILTRNLEGGLETKPFDPDGEGFETESSEKKRSARKKKSV